MAEINFYLDSSKKNKKGQCPIIVRFTFNGFKFKKATGAKSLPEHWQEKKFRIKKCLKSEEYNHYEEFNNKLDQVENKAKAIFKKSSLNNTPLTKALFEKEWNDSDILPSFNDLFKIYDEYLQVNSAIRAERTIKGHVTAYNVLKDYIAYRKTSLTIEEFDLKEFERFRSYAFQVRQISDNYFCTLTNKLKAMMLWSYEREYHKNESFRRFKAVERPKDIICLYKDELFQLYNYQFENKRLERVRDVYCFGCFTGLRFSDIKDLKPEHIKGDEIQKVIIKTKEFTRIPLNKYALEVLDKYKDYIGILPKISDQKFNSYIKEACKIAGIDQLVNITKYSGGKSLQETKPKHELVTSHTARKTFTTNSLIFGMSESVVKRITGHKKEENFRRYVRLADKYVKDEINEAWK